MTETELFQHKLREFRDHLNQQIIEIQRPDQEEIESLRQRLKDLYREEEETKDRIQAVRLRARDNQGRILEVARKLRAVKQLLEDDTEPK